MRYTSFLKLFLLLVFLTVSFSVFAESVLEEKQYLSDICSNYISLLDNKSIKEVYPVFDESKGVSGKIYGFECLNLAKGETDKYTCIYSFENTDLNGAYIKLQEILSNRHKKKNRNIILRRNMPLSNAEDRLNLTQSLKKENQGYTCYYVKSNNELWIHTEPVKGKKAVFILKNNNDNASIYFYENIMPNE